MKVREYHPDEAETVVLLHGGTVAGWMWAQQLSALAGYRVLVPDLPGFGDSNYLRWLSIADTADEVSKVIEGPAHIVGLSLGSSVAIHLAARHPALVEDLLLASTTVTRPSLTERVLGRAMLGFWNMEWFWRGLARAYMLPADSVDLFVTTGLGIDKSTAVSIFEEATRGTPTSLLEAIAAPTLVVVGTKDSASVARDSYRMLEATIPNVRAARAQGLHHAWNIEAPELFNDTMLAWVGRGTVAEGLHG